MNIEELKEKITEVHEECLPRNAHLEKIMLLINLHIESRDLESEKATFDYNVFVDLVMSSQGVINQFQRNGWNELQIKTELEMFTSINYPDGGRMLDMRKHFFNYMKKRKPESKGTSW